jgi:hypothetical protein
VHSRSYFGTCCGGLKRRTISSCPRGPNCHGLGLRSRLPIGPIQQGHTNSDSCVVAGCHQNSFKKNSGKISHLDRQDLNVMQDSDTEMGNFKPKVTPIVQNAFFHPLIRRLIYSQATTYAAHILSPCMRAISARTGTRHGSKGSKWRRPNTRCRRGGHRGPYRCARVGAWLLKSSAIQDRQVGASKKLRPGTTGGVDQNFVTTAPCR